MSSVLALLADEDFDRRIVRGVRRGSREVDLVRVQEVGLSGAGDPAVLEWAAQTGRVLLTHDVTTMASHAYARVEAGLPMPGVCEIRQSAPLGRVIEDLLILIDCSREGEWEGQVLFLPF
jgi:hypothetical protein